MDSNDNELDYRELDDFHFSLDSAKPQVLNSFKSGNSRIYSTETAEVKPKLTKDGQFIDSVLTHLEYRNEKGEVTGKAYRLYPNLTESVKDHIKKTVEQIEPGLRTNFAKQFFGRLPYVEVTDEGSVEFCVPGEMSVKQRDNRFFYDDGEQEEDITDKVVLGRFKNLITDFRTVHIGETSYNEMEYPLSTDQMGTQIQVELGDQELFSEVRIANLSNERIKELIKNIPGAGMLSSELLQPIVNISVGVKQQDSQKGSEGEE